MAGTVIRKRYLTGAMRFLLIRLLRLLDCEYPVSEDISLVELLRVFVCHAYFRYGRHSEFPIYDLDSADPALRGYTSPEQEKRLEYPIPRAALECQGPQELLLSGMNTTSGELLVVRLVRSSQRQAQVHIVVKDRWGRVFTSVDAVIAGTSSSSSDEGPAGDSGSPSNVLPLDTSWGNRYQAGGLRMVCMEPMRKWRIAYNGMMLENKTGQAVYIRFAVLWYALSHVMDWATMVTSKRLMKFCLENQNPNDRMSDTVASIELCRDHLHGFEQSGYLVGTLQIGSTRSRQIIDLDGEQQRQQQQQPPPPQVPTNDDNGGAVGSADEHEVYLRGNFIRIRHPQRTGAGSTALNSFSHSVTFSTKGQFAQLSILKFAQTGRGLVFGSFVGTSGFKDSIDDVLNEQGLEADVHDVLTSPVLKLRTFELSHDLLRSEGELLGSFKSVLGWNNELQVIGFDAMIDGIKATGVTIQAVITGVGNDDLVKPPLNILDCAENPSVPWPFVVPLSSEQCKNCDLTGGKGSSLAVLTELSTINANSNNNNGRNKFLVPLGFVVTTEAFRRFLQSPRLTTVQSDLQKVTSAKTAEEVKLVTEECQLRVQDGPMPSCISKQIRDQLQDAFPDLTSKRFAVRGSRAGEDFEEMFAAGQTETLLGVKGEQEVVAAVLKCWASQFSHMAIEYKWRYGQPLVSDMAVVITEMIPADSAGLMFTCDPLSGDPSTIYITSNFGLGESVVSALTDPDTIRIGRDIRGRMWVSQMTLGKKDMKIVIDQEHGGTRREHVVTPAGSLRSSISMLQAIHLARVGADIERCFGNWCDIEWAFHDDTLFLLKARPVTFMDRPSDFEISVDMEVPARDETACYSRANVGEVLNSAISPLGIDLMSKDCSTYVRRKKAKSARARRVAISPYFESLLKVTHQQYFIDLIEVMHSLMPDVSDRRAVESLMVNLCGQIIEDPHFEDDMVDETDLTPHTPCAEKTMHAIQAKFLPKLCWRYERYMCRRRSRFPSDDMSLDELLTGFLDAVRITTDYACHSHLRASSGALLWTGQVIDYLQSISDESIETICGDMSRLLGSANGVVSCDIPKALEDVAKVVESEIGRENFVHASPIEAGALLADEQNHPHSYEAMKKFLELHGHRGYNEFDVYRKTWAMDPAPLVTSLQAILRNDASRSGTPAKTREGVWKSMSRTTCKLNFWQKLRLAPVVDFARNGIGVRERTKSLWIWARHMTRLWCWALAKRLRVEGRLPDVELLFFCTLSEIIKLVETRDPAIISRAFHRKRLFPTLTELHFLEYQRGTPRPQNLQVPHVPRAAGGDVGQMTGFPISSGRVQARARVISKLDQAHTIQRGEVLITYATDIGWTPYFSLLSGIVTELGGLRSHGAVVAREFGLPCVAGLYGATRVFQTGDLVLLDGASGVLHRIDGEDHYKTDQERPQTPSDNTDNRPESRVATPVAGTMTSGQ